MRLIDADALKKQLCLDKFEAITRSPERRMVTFDEIAAFIDCYAPTIEPKRGEWIPCSERLPSSSGKCLVTEGVERKTTSIGYFSAEYKRFYSAMDVIAWMPLPKPYGERKEGE